MAPSMVKEGKEKKARKSMSAKPKAAKKPSRASSQVEVERSMKIATMLLEKEVVHSEDEGLSDEGYIRSLKVDPIAVEKGDDGFEVDKGEEGIVRVKDVGKEAKVEVVDTRVKRPKVENSLRFLRLAIAEKARKAQEDRKQKLLAKGGFGSDDEE